MSDERRKLQIPIRNIWSGWRVPYLDLPSCSYCEVSTGRRKGERIHLPPEREVIQNYTAWYVCENGAAVFVYGEE